MGFESQRASTARARARAQGTRPSSDAIGESRFERRRGDRARDRARSPAAGGGALARVSAITGDVRKMISTHSRA